MTNSIKQGLKDGNGGNMVTGTKITVFSGTAKLPFDEIKSAYYQAKATKLHPSAKDIRAILGKGSFRDIQAALTKINSDDVTSILQGIDNKRLPPSDIEALCKALAKMSMATRISLDDEKIKDLEDLVLKLNTDLKIANESWSKLLDFKEEQYREQQDRANELSRQKKEAEDNATKYKNEVEALRVTISEKDAELEKLKAIKLVYEKMKKGVLEL